MRNLENMEGTTQRSPDNPVHDVISQVQNDLHHLEDHGDGDPQEQRERSEELESYMDHQAPPLPQKQDKSANLTYFYI